MNVRRWWLIWTAAGALFFLYYILLCAINWKTRMFHVDSAQYLFEILNNDFPFLSPRPASVLTQVIPLTSHHVGMGLKSTAFLYSVSFGMVYTVIALFTFVQTRKLWVIPFFAGILTLGVRDTFYNPVNETTLSIMLAGAAFCFGWQWVAQRQRSQLFLALLLAVISLLAHPIALLMLGGGWIALVINAKNRLVRKQLLVFAVLPVLYLAFRILVGGSDQSENSAMLDILANLSQLNGDNPAIYFFVHHIIDFSKLYLPLVLYSVVVVSLLVYDKKYLAAVLVPIFGFVLLAANAIMMRDGESGLVVEKGLLPLSFAAMLAIPFLWKSKSKNRHLILLGAMMIFGFMKFRHMGMQNGVYQKRLDYLLALNHQAGADKLLVNQADVDMKTVIIPWNTGVESLLYSIATNGIPQTVFLIKQDQTPETWWYTDSTIFLGPQYNPVYTLGELNEGIFMLPLEGYKNLQP